MKIIFLLFSLISYHIATAEEIKMLADPATIHQLFKSCKKEKALYSCSVSGKMLAAILHKTHNAFVAPNIDESMRYTLYWWPNSCIPPANLNEANGCVFTVLLQSMPYNSCGAKSSTLMTRMRNVCMS